MVDRRDISIEYGMQGGGPRAVAAWYNPGAGQAAKERRRLAMRRDQAMLGFRQVSIRPRALGDFIERTRLYGSLRRCLLIEGVAPQVGVELVRA